LDKYIERIKKITLEQFEKFENVKIIFFGSRAYGKNVHTGSDVDIALEGCFDDTAIINLKEELEESTIPYEVDVINLNIADEEFKDKIYKKGIYWKK